MGHQVAREFQPGEEVLVYKPIRKVGRAEKLLHHWHGPYVVQRKTASLNYEVKQKDKRRTEIVHVGKMKPFLGSEGEEVSNEEEAEEERKVEERPGQRKRGKGGRQEKKVQFNIPEEVHGEHESDQEEEGPQRDKDQLRRSTRARRAPDRYSPEVGLAVAVLLLGFCGSILEVVASEGV